MTAVVPANPPLRPPVNGLANSFVRDRPWAALPQGLAALIRAENVRLGPEIVREIRRQIPEYARPLGGGFGVGIQRGATRALAQFAELIADDAAPPEESLQVYRALGRGEWQEGRSLDALQAAYRLGGRLAWRRYAQVARRAGMPPAATAVLAEAIFAHIDEMAAASVEGYSEARADAVGTLRRSRRRLVELLTEGASMAVLVEAARSARWELPEQIAAVALASGGSNSNSSSIGNGGGSATGGGGSGAEGYAAVAAGLRPLAFALAELEGPEPCLYLADPELPGRREQVGRVLADRRAVLGPVVPVGQAGQSLRWARTVAARGTGRGAAGAAPGLLRCDERLSSVLLLGDEELVRLLAARRLAPLDGLTEKRRHRLEATLLVWLESSRGSAPEVAERLGLHPQTARQRMRKIEELFGSALTDPDARFEIELALRGRELMDGPAEV
ncbi:helix-turn-helix domain-containing protein [Streptacidiphilus sp. N1-3]|uniref:Helix-turn-helix domain-containing protein n=1 Tax=Streptacidiphilus alkalitolerans TaxID=3342712 RepID=A0ABV6X4U5_9ACTN